METEVYHDANFAIFGGTGGYRYDNLLCRVMTKLALWQSWMFSYVKSTSMLRLTAFGDTKPSSLAPDPWNVSRRGSSKGYKTP